MTRNNLPKTKDFHIRIVEPVKALEVECYGVYSTDINILEHKDTSITRAFSALNKMQVAFDEMVRSIEQDERMAERAGKIVKI